MNNNTGKALGAASNTIHYAPWYSQVYDAEARLDLKDYYSDYEKKTMVGLFGRLNYNYRERYYARCFVDLRRGCALGLVPFVFCGVDVYGGAVYAGAETLAELR